jgi:hypothetical protein
MEKPLIAEPLIKSLVKISAPAISGNWWLKNKPKT